MEAITAPSTSVDLSGIGNGLGAVGMAVDTATNLLYIVTGGQGPEIGDQLLVFDSNLNRVYTYPDTESMLIDPTGLVIPGVDISYEPTIIVYPNPCYPNQGQEITIKGLPVIATVYIYTVAGELVRTLESSYNGITTWDLRNDSGKEVAEGIYVYYVPEATGEKIGKIAIIKN